MKLRLVFSFLSSQRKDNDNRLCFFFVQRMLSDEYFICCLTCYKVSLCYNATNHYLNPRELRWLGIAHLRNKRIWHLVKTKSVSVPWQFAKHSGISQMILADCLCDVPGGQSQMCRRWFAEQMSEIGVRRRKAKRMPEFELLLETLKSHIPDAKIVECSLGPIFGGGFKFCLKDAGAM